MKNRIAALSLTLALTAGLCTPAHAAESQTIQFSGDTAIAVSSFTDVPQNHYAIQAITRVADAGIMSGVGNNCFAPNETMTYAQFIAMLTRCFFADGIQTSDEFFWSSGSWWSPYLYAAYNAHLDWETNLSDFTRHDNDGIVVIEGGLLVHHTFPMPEITPDSPVSRYEVARLIYNSMLNKYGIHSPGYDISKIPGFPAMDLFNQAPVRYCYANGFLSGVDGEGNFEGEKFMTRAEAAVVMDRLLSTKVVAEQAAPISTEIPADAFMLTDTNTKIRGDGSSYTNGVFTLQNSGFTGTGGYIQFTNTGYTTLTFTVKANGAEHGIGVGGNDSIYGETRLLQYQLADTTATYTADISGIKSVSMRVCNGRTCDATVTNIYLTK